MKQRHRHLPLAALLLLASAIVLWKAPRSARLAAVDQSQEPERVSTPAPIEVPTVQLQPDPPRAEAAVEPVAAAPDPEVTESIETLIAGTNPMDIHDLNRTVQKLRTWPQEQVAAWLLQNLKDLGTERPDERDRLVMVANSLQSPAALPFWVDLVKRETPRFPGEEKLRNPPHPTLESRFVDMEQLQAIRNIGLLARDDRAARRVLMEVILKPDPSAHRTLHREQAYVALKEADLAASLRVLKQLAAEDELLKRL